MKDGYIVLALVILSGCSRGPLKDVFFRRGVPQHISTTDHAFYEYLDQLSMMSYTPIVFRSIEKEDTAATCDKWKSGYKEIRIDPEYWQKVDDSNRLALLAHEIGHCDYNLDHDDNLMVDENYRECPVSVMNSTNFGDPCFTDNFYYYMAEFDE